MSQLFDAEGAVVPVSVIQVGPCVVLEKKSATGKDRYSAVKIGFEQVPENKSVAKPVKGYFDKLKLPAMRFLRELRVTEEQLADFEVGTQIGASVFEEGDVVDIIGNSKGRGFTGVMKRHGFKGIRATHGTHESRRGGGSNGSNTYPGRVWPGKKMPGHHGATRKTAQNVKVIQVLPDQNLLIVKGAVPGHRNTVLLIKNAVKKWKR
jgi:large subunit ribosomal protein L3